MSAPRRISRAQWTLAGLIVALAIGALLYRLLVSHRLEQTAALFIGLPAVLAAILALTPKAQSNTGMILKGMILALLMSGPVLGEGFICIVMAAPIFLLVGLLIGLTLDWRKRRAEDRGTGTLGLALCPLLLMSLEGLNPRLSFSRQETVVVTRLIAASAVEVDRALARAPHFESPLPAYLRLGFPRPVSSLGEGVATGDRRVIHFAGGEGKPGDLTLEVESRDESHITFRVVSDGTHVAHWLRLENSTVSWKELGPGQTQVTWRLDYERRLDPAWYFGPWEKYGVRCAANYLIDAVATPGSGR